MRKAREPGEAALAQDADVPSCRHFLQVGPGAEDGAVAGDDADAQVTVSLEGVKVGVDFGGQAFVGGVARLRAVQYQQADVLADALRLDVFRGCGIHGASIRLSTRTRD